MVGFELRANNVGRVARSLTSLRSAAVAPIGQAIAATRRPKYVQPTTRIRGSDLQGVMLVTGRLPRHADPVRKFDAAVESDGAASVRPSSAPIPRAGHPASAAFGTKLLAYSRLAKCEFFDFYLSIPVVWSMLGWRTKFQTATFRTLGLALTSQFGVVSAVMALDDITGFKDGSDAVNYGPEGSGLRKLERKPLLTGELSLAEATRFGYAALAWGAGFMAAAIATAAFRPRWAVLLSVLALVGSVQYSWAAKLSYHWLGEALIALCPMIIVAVTFGLITGTLTPFVLLEAVLFGLWQILVSSYSNTNDARGDALVGRHTIAASTTALRNRGFIGALSALDLILMVIPVLRGPMPRRFLIVMLPAIGLRVEQYARFLLTGDALRARKRGVYAHRSGVAGVVASNLTRGVLAAA